MFSPIEFKNLSLIIKDFRSIEEQARYRTSISRLYYYIFLEIREILTVNFKKDDRETFLKLKPMHHCLIPEILLKLGLKMENPDIIRTAQILKNARRERNEADYQLTAIFAEHHVKMLNDDIKELENHIYQIPKINNIRNLLSESLHIAIRNCKEKHKKD